MTYLFHNEHINFYFKQKLIFLEIIFAYVFFNTIKFWFKLIYYNYFNFIYSKMYIKNILALLIKIKFIF